MRLFISADISDELKEKIVQLQKKFIKPGVKLVEKENLHFCLLFLGDVNDDKLEMIENAMKNVAKNKKIIISIAGIGAFPNKDFANVFFLDVKDGRKDLINLANALRKELPEFKSGKPFTPHLTLGRVKFDNDKLKTIFNEVERIEIGKMTIDKIALINSTLTPGGPVYEELFSANFI